MAKPIVSQVDNSGLAQNSEFAASILDPPYLS